MVNKYEAIIIGAGAAGLMCAYQIGKKGKQVLLLEHSHKLAEKIRISGGGRCNFTNLNTMPNCYMSQNQRFCISALSGYTPYHFMELLDKYNITYHEKTLGQMFCDERSEKIIELLDHLCNSNNVIRKMGISIKKVEKATTNFIIETSNGNYTCENLIIATGGLSIPQIGATGFGYNIARQFDIKVIETSPALVPLALSPEQLQSFNPLSGISFFSETSTAKISFQENTLLTHRGLSGPAILQISSYWQSGSSIKINFLPHADIASLIIGERNNNKLLSNFLTQFFSQRLAENICQLININKPISQISNAEIKIIDNFIHNFAVKPSGTLGYKKAEVTKGGIDTKNLSSKTMMANKVDGLYFIGEVVDVTGWLGGYNFQWAWASAYACAANL